MINSKKQAATLDVLDFLAAKKVIRLYPDNQRLDGNILTLRDKQAVHFGSCSYLGLEFDPRLIDGSIQASQNFGTQFSISRAYMSCPLYQELEDNFRTVFGKPCIITPTTTLGHLAAIPVLVGEDDAVILDHQVHSSVQMAVQMVKANGVTIQMIRHNRMDMLEDRIKKLRINHKKIWYMADGIYSMYGDKAPLDEIYALMDKYPELHLYIDDAHGMSCYGDNGEGYVLGHGPTNERTIVTLSLAKAFGSGGAVFVFPTEEMAHRVQQTGLPLITGGPIQPAVLGASIASSRLHLNPEIQEMQEDLFENIKYTNILLKKHRLPLVS
jgi:7-keto-8-aminopelargonate synthetase-like enzyme